MAAIATAEMAYRLPPGLLLAIARTESGRPDAKTGMVQPWPWTMNVNGVGSYANSQTEAVSQVTELAKQANISIDVGCMQVNLQQHPTAFHSIQDAFDPTTNARYAAKFLTELYAQANDWVQATGYYHSHTPALGVPYRNAVQARMAGPALTTRTVVAASPEAVLRKQLRSAWAATLSDDGPNDGPKPIAKPLEIRRRLASEIISQAVIR